MPNTPQYLTVSCLDDQPHHILTVYGSTITFVLTNPQLGPIGLHCVVQVLKLMPIDIFFFINIPFLLNTIPFEVVNSTF